jgi:hypothetical protein
LKSRGREDAYLDGVLAACRWIANAGFRDQVTPRATEVRRTSRSPGSLFSGLYTAASRRTTRSMHSCRCSSQSSASRDIA